MLYCVRFFFHTLCLVTNTSFSGILRTYNFSDRRIDMPAGLLDMSAVFNTGDHAVLISELCSVDVVVIAMKWNKILVYSCYFR